MASALQRGFSTRSQGCLSLPRPIPLLYLRPSDPTRSGIVEYSRHFLRALELMPEVLVVDFLPLDLTEILDSRKARAIVERCASQAAAPWRETHPQGEGVIVHIEQGNALHREFWAGWRLMRELPRARFFCTLHDPPALCPNPYRYVRTEFEGATPLRVANVALTWIAEHAVDRAKDRALARFVLGCQGGIAVLSDAGLELARSHPLWRHSRLVRLPHVFVPPDRDTEETDAGPKPPGNPPLIAFFGFLGPERGIEDLLEAFERLLDRLGNEGTPADALPHLCVFGGLLQSSRTASWLERTKARVGISPHKERIAWTPGFVPDAERDRRLARADIVVLPYRETPGVVFSSAGLVRAMGMGKAVVAARTVGLAAAVQDGINGLLYPPGDAAALAECLHRLTLDASLRRSISEAARRHIETEYSPLRVAQALRAFYRLPSRV